MKMEDFRGRGSNYQLLREFSSHFPLKKNNYNTTWESQQNGETSQIHQNLESLFWNSLQNITYT